jgi:hypothetical protein
LSRVRNILARRDVMEIRYTEKAVSRQSRLNSSRPHGSGLFAVLWMGIFLLVLTVSGRPALAADDHDQLHVTGVIKSVNVVTGLVTVDIVSSSCHGMRIFKADDLEKLDDYVEQKVSFFINSNKCEVKETYTIITARGLLK